MTTTTLTADCMAELNDRANRVRGHVPEQPWGRGGSQPLPLEMYFHGDMWTVRFVVSLTPNGRRRRWGFVSGATLDDALREARRVQVNTQQYPLAR